MEKMTEKLPGSFVEEKEFGVAFHYRKSDPDLAILRVRELANFLVSYTSNMDIQLQAGIRPLK
jgi:trehalose 6-phosphate synthase/phosphatase